MRKRKTEDEMGPSEPASVGVPRTATEEASSVLKPDTTLNPGASMPPFMGLPFLPPVPGPAHRPPWGQQPPPLMTAAFPPGTPLVLSALPATPLLGGDSARGPSGAGTFNVLVQVRPEAGPVQPPHTQTLVLAQAPLNWSAPGALCGGAKGPAPLLWAAPPVETVMPAPVIGSAPVVGGAPVPGGAPVLGSVPVVGGVPASEGGWFMGLPHPEPPPATQLAAIVSPMKARPQPLGACREGSLPPSQANASRDDSCNTKSVYENYRRWQRFKSLAQRHLPQSPDTEALSCFLIPVLRTLARLKPTMTLEEGLWRAMQEWQHKSNFDRMVFYDMAGKFMEFEEEEMQHQQLQWIKGSQFLPPPASPRPAPRGPPAPEAVQQPVVLPRKAGPKARPAHLPPPAPQRRPPETKVPMEIPAESVKEYVDIMDKLLGLPHRAPDEPDAQWEEEATEQSQDEAGTYPDPGLLSYVDKLCSQEGFITKVEAVIHPRFLEELLSPEASMDSLALSQELEQEEGLTLDQLVEKRLLDLKEKRGVGAAPSRGAPRLDSSPSKSAAGRGADSDGCGPRLGVGAEPCPPQTAARAPQGHGRVQAELPGPKAPAHLSGHPESPRLRAARPASPPQGRRPSSPGLGTRDALGLPGASPVGETLRPGDGSSEDQEELPSLTFLLSSQYRLVPWRLSQSPVPAQPPSAQRRGLSLAAPTVAKSKKQTLSGGPSSAEETAHPGPQLGVSGGQPLALGPGRSSQPRKRRGNPFVSGTRKKRRRSL
ncbi:NUT family member 2G-like [Lemur catta]|uniref:NUT family member 2G-like n=1 Tax=Lemur catta TaxID=9447 RepID=UPI001E269821|nr:NUT family member 2G-like [Lemur catta]